MISPRLRRDWRRTLRTWSVWLLFASVAMDSIQIGLQILVDHDKWLWSPLAAALVIGGLNLAAFGSRFVAQQKLGTEEL